MIAGLTSFIIGGIVLLAYVTGSPHWILSVIPGEIAMKPMTAGGFMAFGLASILDSGHRHAAALALTFATLLTLGVQLAIVLAAGKEDQTPAPGTLLCFAMLGIGMMLRGARKHPTICRAAFWTTAGIGGMAVIGYVVGLRELYWWHGHGTAMAAHTAFVHLVLGLNGAIRPMPNPKDI